MLISLKAPLASLKALRMQSFRLTSLKTFTNASLEAYKLKGLKA